MKQFVPSTVISKCYTGAAEQLEIFFFLGGGGDINDSILGGHKTLILTNSFKF